MVSQLFWEEADGNLVGVGEVVQMMVAEVLVICEELAGPAASRCERCCCRVARAVDGRGATRGDG
jgi:hypothetical protein